MPSNVQNSFVDCSCQIIENAPYVGIGWQFAFQPTDLCNCEVKTHCLQIQMSKVKNTLVYFDKLGYWIEAIVRLFNLSSVKGVVLWIDFRCFILAMDLKRGKHQIWHKYSLLECHLIRFSSGIFERHFRVVGRLVWIKFTSCEPSALSFNIGKKYKLNHYIQFDR